jgi:hypothetical protein
VRRLDIEENFLKKSPLAHQKVRDAWRLSAGCDKKDVEARYF